MARPVSVTTSPAAHVVRERLGATADALARVELRLAATREERDRALEDGRAAGLTWRELAAESRLASAQSAERIVRSRMARRRDDRLVTVEDGIRTIDLFAGAGGLSLGFHLAATPRPFVPVFAVEHDTAAARTFERNF